MNSQAIQKAKYRAVVIVGIAAICSIVVFFVARALTHDWLVGQTLAEWSTRPEIENWANPDVGTQVPSYLVGAVAAVVTFLALAIPFAMRRAKTTP